jgi:preprotein translocase subunit SecF
MPLPELIDRSINETLARTLMTSLTTLLALIALVAFGGPVIRDVASPIVLHLNLRRESVAQPAETAGG